MGTTPKKDAMRAEFTAPDGVVIRYSIVGALNDRPVVLHHGFAADTRTNWIGPGIVSALREAGHCIVSPDARGHGNSDKPHAPSFYGERTMARDLRQLVDLLGVRSYDLVGYSMGAIVALLVATEDARIRRLVLGGIGAGAVELGGVDTRALAPGAIVKALETVDPQGLGEGLDARFRAFADAIGADRAALAAQARSVHAAPIAFEAITARTLVVAGDADPLATRPDVLAGAIAGAELRRVRGDHMGALLDPGFKGAIVSFLA